MLSRNTIMGTYRSGSLSSQSFAVPGREMVSRCYAMTDHEGQFEIGDIPPGTYKMVIWHPYLGSTKEKTITIQPKIQAKGDIKIPAPTWRLYANFMVDKPYTRFGVTDDLQSRIVPAIVHRSCNPIESPC